MSSIKFGESLREINKLLAVLACEIRYDADSGFFDGHVDAEELFRKLMNLIYSCNLENLNLIKKNFPAVDLADKNKRLAVQITASKDGATKIRHTVDLFVKNNLHREYSVLEIVFIGDKPKLGKIINNEFTLKVKDISDLIKDIGGLSLEKVDEIREFLRKNLTKFESRREPIRFNQSDIKKLILSVADVLDKSAMKLSASNITDRGEDFLKKKNALNNLDELYFNFLQENAWKYSTDIIQFLGEPINVTIKRVYFSVATELNSKYLSNRSDFQSIALFFDYIYNQVRTSLGDEIDDPRKIYIMIYNMYLNCDLGANPK